MHLYKHVIPLFVALVVSLSCQTVTGESEKRYDARLVLDFPAMAFADEESTRSTSVDDDDAVSDLNVFIYCDGELFWETFRQSSSSITVDLPADRRYTVYATANEGERAAPTMESDLLSGCEYRVAGSGRMGAGLIPMSSRTGVQVDLTPGNHRIAVPLVRLAARLDFYLDTSGLVYGDFEISSVRMCQANGSVRMFADANAATLQSGVLEGDHSSMSDIGLLQAGSPASFFILENCQGTLLPDNTDPWNKEYFNAGIAGRKDVCTYLEVTGTYRDDSGGLRAEHIYKMYLGEDATSNFDVVRNNRYTLTLSVSDLGIFRDSWKVTRKGVEDNRQIYFDPDVLDITGIGSATTALRTYPPGLDYILEWDSLSFSASGLSDPMVTSSLVSITSHGTVQSDTVLTIHAFSFDRQLCASCSVSLHPRVYEPLKINWKDSAPHYVAQAGIIQCSNVYDGSVLSATSSDELVARIVKEEDAFRVEALREGSTTIYVTREDGDESSSCQLDLNISPVYLQNPGRCYQAYADGAANARRIDDASFEEWVLSYDQPREIFDDALYAELLKPVGHFVRYGTAETVDYFSVDESSLLVSNWRGGLSRLPGRYQLSMRPNAEIYAGPCPDVVREVEVAAPISYSGSLAFECENRWFMPDTETSVLIRGNESIALSLGDSTSLKLCLTRLDGYAEDRYHVPCRVSDTTSGNVIMESDYADVNACMALHDFRGGYKVFARLGNAMSGESETMLLGPADVLLCLAVTSRLERWDADYECDGDGDFFLIPCLYYDKLPSGIISLDDDYDPGSHYNDIHIPQSMICDMPDVLDFGLGREIPMSETYPGHHGLVYSNYQVYDRGLGARCLSLSKVMYHSLDFGDDIWDNDWYCGLPEYVGNWMHCKYGWHLYDPFNRVSVPDGGYFDILVKNGFDYHLRIVDFAVPITEHVVEGD